MKLVYVAGPFRGKSAWDIECNIRAAEAWGLEVARAGAVPVIPHTMYRFFDRVLPDEFWLEATTDILLRCDMILLTPGWEKSQGSIAEAKAAEMAGIPEFRAEQGCADGGCLSRAIAEIAGGPA